MTETTIYKICTAAEWDDAARTGSFTGSAVDKKDGFTHFSTAVQVAETARRHFAGQSDLVLVTVDTGKLKAPLKWEESRGGALFPHLYGALPVAAAVDVTPLPWNDGVHTFPSGLSVARH